MPCTQSLCWSTCSQPIASFSSITAYSVFRALSTPSTAAPASARSGAKSNHRNTAKLAQKLTTDSAALVSSSASARSTISRSVPCSGPSLSPRPASNMPAAL